MAATETGVDVFAAEGDVNLAGTMAATESTTDTFSGLGTVTISGQMAETETGTNTFAPEGDEQKITCDDRRHDKRQMDKSIDQRIAGKFETRENERNRNTGRKRP